MIKDHLSRVTRFTRIVLLEFPAIYRWFKRLWYKYEFSTRMFVIMHACWELNVSWFQNCSHLIATKHKTLPNFFQGERFETMVTFKPFRYKFMQFHRTVNLTAPINLIHRHAFYLLNSLGITNKPRYLQLTQIDRHIRMYFYVLHRVAFLMTHKNARFLPQIIFNEP